MSAYWRVTEVRVIEDHAVWVCFKDGLEGIVRFLPGFFRGVFSHLSDPAKFRQVKVESGAVTWPGDLDLAPDAMHEEIKLHGEWLLKNKPWLSLRFPEQRNSPEWKFKPRKEPTPVPACTGKTGAGCHTHHDRP